MAEGGAFAALAEPFLAQIGAKDRAQHEHQIDEHEVTEGDADHGGEGCGSAWPELRAP